MVILFLELRDRNFDVTITKYIMEKKKIIKKVLKENIIFKELMVRRK